MPCSPVRREVDLLVLVLPDVADPEVAGGAVEREPPRVAQAPHPRLGHARRCGRRTGCRRARCRPRCRRGSGSMRRIFDERRARGSGRCRAGRLAAAVAEPDVEHAVGPERDLAAVVVRSTAARRRTRGGACSGRRRRRASCTRRRSCRRCGRCSRRRAALPSGENVAPRKPCSLPWLRLPLQVERGRGRRAVRCATRRSVPRLLGDVHRAGRCRRGRKTIATGLDSPDDDRLQPHAHRGEIGGGRRRRRRRSRVVGARRASVGGRAVVVVVGVGEIGAVDGVALELRCCCTRRAARPPRPHERRRSLAHRASAAGYGSQSRRYDPSP